MKKALLAVLLLASVPALAAHGHDLRALTHELDEALATADVDEATAEKIRQQLRESIRLARSGGTLDSRCLDLAVEAYSGTHQRTAALEMGAKLCRGRVDTEVLRFANGVFEGTLYPADALAKAAAYAKRDDLRGKADLLAFAYEKYRKSFYAADSLKLAADFVAPLPRGSESCIARAFETYSKQYYAQDALKQSAKLCTQ